MKITDHDHGKSNNTQEWNKLTTYNFTARLKQVNLASKNGISDFVKNTDFDEKLKTYKKKQLQTKQTMYWFKMN